MIKKIIINVLVATSLILPSCDIFAYASTRHIHPEYKFTLTKADVDGDFYYLVGYSGDGSEFHGQAVIGIYVEGVNLYVKRHDDITHTNMDMEDKENLKPLRPPPTNIKFISASDYFDSLPSKRMR